MAKAPKTHNSPISPRPAESEFRKAVEAIAVRPQSGRLTLLTRKLFNILLFHAQRQGTDNEAYRIELAEVISDADFDSKDTQLVKDHLSRIQDTKVVWNDPGRSWEREPMLSHLKLEKIGGRVWLEWSYPPKIRQTLLSPNVYTRLSLYFQAMLRTNAGLALYEVAKRYVTNPGGITLREDWRWWYHILTGNAEFDASLEYKYFKRDTLKPAIAEVNQITDLSVELIEHKAGRRIDQIQFVVSQKPQAQFELNPPRAIDASLLERLLRLGLDEASAGDIYAQHDEDFLRATVELVEARLKNTVLPPVGAPAAFFRTALKKKFALAKPPKPKPAPKLSSPEDRIQKLRAELMNKRRDEARELYRELREAEQGAHVNEFISGLPEGRLRSEALKRGLTAKPVEVEFATWLAHKLWGDPTTEDLLLFALPERT